MVVPVVSQTMRSVLLTMRVAGGVAASRNAVAEAEAEGTMTGGLYSRVPLADSV